MKFSTEGAESITAAKASPAALAGRDRRPALSERNASRPCADVRARRSLSTAEIAARIVTEPEPVIEHYDAILCQEQERGFVVVEGDGWRLSQEAEARFGRALREMHANEREDE